MWWLNKEERLLVNTLKSEVEDLKTEKIKLVNEALMNTDSIKLLKEERETLERAKKMDIEEIKHLNKLAQEKRDIELEKEKAKIQVTYQKDRTKLMEEFHAKVEKRFGNEMDNLKSIYSEIIKRLPDVNMEIKKRSK